MECISLIGVAVGKERFFNDAKEVMNIMMQTQAGNLEPDDPQISFMQQAWARICKSLGSDFVQFLPYVMPSLIASASTKTDLVVYDAEEDTSDKEGWDFVVVNDKQVGVNTSSLEDKSTACHMLYCYADELEEGFFPYVDEVAKLMVPLLKFFYHDGVRLAAVSCAPALLVSAANYVRKTGGAQPGADATYVRNLFTFIYDTFLEAMRKEIDIEILCSMLESVVECLDTMREAVLNPGQFAATKECMKHLIADYSERKQEQSEKREGPDVDEEEEEKLNEEGEKDDECLSQIGDVIGCIVKYHKSAFLPYFEELLPTVIDLLQPDRSTLERQTALCILDDVVEHTGKDSLKLFPHFLQHYISYISDENPGVRQAAVYGLGICAQVGGDQLAPLIPDILTRLNVAITNADARNEENINATENAISAVGRICEAHAGSLNLTQVLPLWLSYLPVKTDKVESRVIYGLLCSFVEKASTQILGQGYQNLVKIVSVFADVLGTDLVDDTITLRIVTILKQMQQIVPANVMQTAWANLTPEHQLRIQEASR